MKTMKTTLAIAALTLTGFATSSLNAAVTLADFNSTHGSFETPVTTSITAVSTATLPEWAVTERVTVVQGGGTLFGVVPSPTAVDGEQWLGLPNSGSGATIDISDTLNGQQYRVDFSLSIVRVANAAADFPVNLDINVDGGAVEFNFTGNETDFGVDAGGDLSQVPSIIASSFTFTADADGTALSLLSNLSSTADDQGIIIDGMTFTAIPEPSSYALIAGMLGLGFVMIRRRS